MRARDLKKKKTIKIGYRENVLPQILNRARAAYWEESDIIFTGKTTIGNKIC